MKPKAKFLTVAWGAEYIERFTEYALPSYLAPGNLPALAAATDLEIVFMTTRKDIAVFERHHLIRLVREVCPISFIEIDDLISSAVYGVTLTLAYARAVFACGEDMLRTHFVFMNTDFVLADGSLRTLSRHILAGRSIVLAPSFRATAEALEPGLRDAVDPVTRTLAMTPRELVGRALAHPHPTTIAKIVNQGFCHSVQPNQFYWRVDEHTMLARFYLIFMLCLRPERLVREINSYCDYGFVPEMCPSGDTAVMDDSDEFFMLELQRREQEWSLLRLGRMSHADTARALQEWTTAEHRRAAGYDLVFHARDVPPELARVKQEAATFVRRIAQLTRRPVPHAYHPYWVGGVEAWQSRRIAAGLRAFPRELALKRWTGSFRLLPRARDRLRQAVKGFALSAHEALLGRPPRVTWLHTACLDYRLLQSAFESVSRSPARCVLVVHSKELPPGWLPAWNALVATAAGVEDGELERAGYAGQFTHALLFLRPRDWASTLGLLARCRPLMAHGGECQVFIHNRDHEETDYSNFSFAALEHLEKVLESPLHSAEFHYVGGLMKLINQRMCTALGGQFSRFGVRSLPLLIPLLVVILPIVGLTNLAASNRRSDAFVQHCSSILIRIRF